MLSAAIGAFHGNYIPLYYDAANCYGAAGVHFDSRPRDFPNYAQTAVIALLVALAVSAKEIAFSFPLIIVIYEVLWHRGLRFQQYRVGLLSAVIVAGCAAARVWGPDGLGYMGGYQPPYSIGAYLA